MSLRTGIRCRRGTGIPAAGGQHVDDLWERRVHCPATTPGQAASVLSEVQKGQPMNERRNWPKKAG